MVRGGARMAKKARKEAAERKPDLAAPSTPLGKARWALEVGDLRRARALAEEAARSGPESERAEAERLLQRLRPDPAAMLTVALVLLLIVFAAWAAILHAH